MDRVREWLQSISLHQYVDAFDNEGWDDMDIVLSMTEEEVKSVVHKPGHVKKILVSLKRLEHRQVTREREGISVGNGKTRTNKDGLHTAKLENTSGAVSQTNDETLTISSATAIATATNLIEDGSDSEAIITEEEGHNLKIHNSALQHIVGTHDLPDHSKERSCFQETSQSLRFHEENVYLGQNNDILEATDSDSSQDESPSLTCVPRGHIAINDKTVVAKQGMPMSLTTNTIVKDSKNVTIARKVQYVTAETGKRHSNFETQIRDCLAAYRAKEKQLFVKTRAYNEAMNILEDRNWVNVIGNSGDGKSTIAHQLLLEYERKGYDPLIVTAPNDWKEMVGGNSKHSHRQVVLIDDMFGVCNVHETTVNKWLSLLECMANVVSERRECLKIVCTSRRFVFNQVVNKIQKFKEFGKLSIVDLTTSPLCLSQDEKILILTRYFDHYHIDMDHELWNLEDIASIDFNYGFPHCVDIFCTNNMIRKQGSNFFRYPIKLVQNEIEEYMNNDKRKFCVLLLVLLSNDNEVCIENLDENSEMFDTCLKLSGLSTHITKYTLIDAFISLQNVYLKKEGDTYVFKHDSFKEIVARHFAVSFPKHAIQLLNLSILIDWTNIEGSGHSTLQLMVSLSKNTYEDLAERLTNEILNGNAWRVFDHISWQDQSFQEYWLHYLKSQINVDAMLFPKLLRVVSKSYTMEYNLLVFLAYHKLETILMFILSLEDLNTYFDRSILCAYTSAALIVSSWKDLSHTILQKLIEAGANTNCRLGSFNEIEMLIFVECRILPKHQTALWVAVERCNYENCKVLLQGGANVLHPNQNADFLFSIASTTSESIFVCLLQHLVRRGSYIAEVEKIDSKLIQVKHLSDVNYVMFFCNSIMQNGVGTQFENVIVDFCGEEICEKTKSNTSSATSFVFKHLNLQKPTLTEEAILKFINRDVTSNEHTENEMTILHEIMANNRLLLKPETFNSLIQVLDCNKQDIHGNIPLFYALQFCGELDKIYVDALIDKSDLTLTNNAKRNVLHFLALTDARSDFSGFLKTLLQRGVDIDALDKDGNVPIVYSASYEITEMFHKHGARLDIINEQGADILKQMLKTNTSDIIGKVSFLLENGANVKGLDSCDFTVLHYLVDTSYTFEVKKVLIDLFLKHGCDQLKQEESMKKLILHFFVSTQWNRDLFQYILSRTNVQLQDIDISFIKSPGDRYVQLEYLQSLKESKKAGYGVEMYAEIINCWSGCACIDFISLLCVTESTVIDCICVTILSKQNESVKHRLLKDLLSKVPTDLNGCVRITQSIDLKLQVLSLPICINLLMRHGLRAELLCISNVPFDRILSNCSLRSLQRNAIKGLDLRGILGIKNTSLLLNLFARKGNLKAVRALMKHSDLNYTITDESGNTIIHNLMGRPGHVHVNVIKAVCSRVLNVNAKNAIGETPLMVACLQKRLDLNKIKSLVENGGNLLCGDSNAAGFAPIHILMRKIGRRRVTNYSHIKDFFLYLISTEVWINTVDNFGRTPIMHLLQSARSYPPLDESIICLFNQGKDFDQHDFDGMSLLHFIAQSALSDDSKTNISNILLTKGLSASIKDSSGRSPIDMTRESSTSSIKLCRQLSLGVPSEKVGQCLINNIEHVIDPADLQLYIKQILEYEGMINYQDITGVTFVSLACRHINTKLVERCLHAGADPNIPDVLWHSAIFSLLFAEISIDLSFWFCYCFGLDVVEELDFQRRSQFPSSVLPLLVYDKLRRQFNKKRRHSENFCYHSRVIEVTNTILEILQLLLKHGADPNHVDRHGKTPLHYCAEAPLIDSLICPFMEILLSHGAKVNAEDFKGRTPLMLCAAYERTKYRRMNILLKSGADIFCEDEEGKIVQDYTLQGAWKMRYAMEESPVRTEKMTRGILF